MAERSFQGEIVDYYHRFRRGFPPPVVDTLVAALGLTGDDAVVDLGCGTGQLALPLAGRVRAVVGMDPEPDMLDRARGAAGERGATNLSWLLGGDADLPAVGALLGGQPVGAVTVATAIHLLDHERLFGSAAKLLRPGGGIAVIANGTPLWLLDTAWSRTVHDCLAQWSGHRADYACGTDAAARAGYRDALARAGFEVSETVYDYSAELSLEELVGNVFSAMGGKLPAPADRLVLAGRIREALHPQVRFTEPVRVAALIGRLHR